MAKGVFYCFSLLMAHSSLHGRTDATDCETPNGSPGICTPIRQCQQFVYLLQNAPKPIPIYYKKAIRSYQCAKKTGSNVKVCCSEDPVLIPPPNLDNHKNWDLLPDEDKCGYTPGSSRIVNGNKTGVFEFPWMALLNYQTPRGPDYRCGGTVINSRYILTASHCLVDQGVNKLIGVRVGEHDITIDKECETLKNGTVKCAPPPQDLQIAEVISHPNYDKSTHQNDIGLIRVAPPYIDISVDNVFPVCLPFGDFDRGFNYDYGVVSGWGATERKRFSPELLKVLVGVRKDEECRTAYKRNTNVTYLQMCAGGRDKKDSCSGDSGGPFQALGSNGERVQHGVVSFGPVYCGLEGRPTVYTKVVYFMDWILDTIRP